MVDIDAIPAIARAVFGSAHSHLRTAIGDDDCAVIEVKDGCLVLTTDLMNHKPALMTLELPNRYYNYGYLMASANLSDLYGSGARPIALLIGLLVPEGLHDGSIREIMHGIEDCCRQHDVPVVGGDTKRSEHLQGYAVAIGEVPSFDAAFTRIKALAGQELLVSGALGNFNAAAYLLARGVCPEEWLDEAYNAITRPVLRRDLSLSLAARKIARGGLDISDGLGMDLWRLANASGVGLRVDSDQVPIGSFALRAAERFGLDPLAFVFATGGDWQFAFTCDHADLDICLELGAVRIGSITAQEGCSLDLGTGDPVALPVFGHSDDRGLEFGDEVRLGVDNFGSVRR